MMPLALNLLDGFADKRFDALTVSSDDFHW